MEFRNPDEDLPRDFDLRRTEHYQALRKPLDASMFIDALQSEMRAELGALNDAMPLDWLQIRPRPGNQGAVKLSPLDALPEPANLGRLKKVIVGRWGTVALIDVLKEAVLRSDCRITISSMFGRGEIAGGQLLERLLLVLYAYGTNAGIRAVAAGEHGHREDELYYIPRRYLSADLVRALAIDIANATFGARQQTIWGAGSTTVASDSTHFPLRRLRCADLLARRTQVHGDPLAGHQLLRVGGRGDDRRGDAPRHRDGRRGQLHDTHGQSIIRFGLTRVLGFDLLPRIKAINRVRLYRPSTGEPIHSWARR